MKYIKQIQFLILLLSCITSSGQRVLRTDSTLHVYGGYNKVTYYETIKPKQEKRVDTPIYEILPSLYPKVIKKVTYFGYEIEAFGRQLEVGKEYEVIDEGLCENLNCPSYCYTIKGISSVGHRLNGRVPFDTLVFSKRKYAPKFEEIFKIDTIITRDTITKTWIDTIRVAPKKKVAVIQEGVYPENFDTSISGDTVEVLKTIRLNCGCRFASVKTRYPSEGYVPVLCHLHKDQFPLQLNNGGGYLYVREKRLKFL